MGPHVCDIPLFAPMVLGCFFMVFHGSRLVFNGFSWFHVGFHGFSWFKVGFDGFRFVFMVFHGSRLVFHFSH